MQRLRWGLIPSPSGESLVQPAPRDQSATTNMEQGLVRQGVVRPKPGWHYFLDADGDVARVRDDDEWGAEQEKIKTLGILREPGKVYVIDDAGDLLWYQAYRILRLQHHPLDIVHDGTSYFEPVENRYWILLPGTDTRRLPIGKGRVFEHWTGRPPDRWAPGDRLILWQPRDRKLALGEIMWIYEPSEDGQRSYVVAWSSPVVTLAPALRDEVQPLLTHMPPYEDDGDHLEPVQQIDRGERLLKIVREQHRRLRTVWLDPADTGRAAPVNGERLSVYEDCCIYDIMKKPRLEALATAGGGTETINGDWRSKFGSALTSARAQGKSLLVLYDNADLLLNPGYAAIVNDIHVEQVHDRKYRSTVTLESFQRLERRYLFTKLRKRSDNKPVHPENQRGALACYTPRLFIKQGLLRNPRISPSTRPPLPPPQPQRVGVPFVAVGILAATVEREPFAVDPNEVDRALQAHASTLDRLADAVRGRRLEPRSAAPGEPDFDLAWEADGTLHVAEVKSLTLENEERQLRLGLGQVLRYRHQLEVMFPSRKIVAVLAAEREPTDPSWLTTCHAVDVRLVWPKNFKAAFTPGGT